MARQMADVFGMSETVGLARVAQRHGPMFLAGGDGQFQRDCSEKTAQQIDEEVKKILDQSYAEAIEILALHRESVGPCHGPTAKAGKRSTGRPFSDLIGKEPRPEVTPPWNWLPSHAGQGLIPSSI